MTTERQLLPLPGDDLVDAVIIYSAAPYRLVCATVSRWTFDPIQPCWEPRAQWHFVALPTGPVPEWADRLRRARESRGLTQHQVAQHVGVSRTTFGLWERGARLPRRRHWLRWFRVLDLSRAERAAARRGIYSEQPLAPSPPYSSPVGGRFRFARDACGALLDILAEVGDTEPIRGCGTLPSFRVTGISLLRKRRTLRVWRPDPSSSPCDLPAAARALPRAVAELDGLPRLSIDEGRCCEPGCALPAVATLRHHPRIPRSRPPGVEHVRPFCALHMRRGCARLSDGQRDYRPLSGPSLRDAPKPPATPPGPVELLQGLLGAPRGLR